MRRGTAIFIIINLITIGYLTNACSTLISLLFEDAAADAILPEEIPAPGSDLIDGQTHLIPKIIHQTYINETIPAKWLEGQQSCIKLHPDYEYKLWTDDLSRKFIAENYSWFLETFDSYPNNIQRADSIRYFVLAHYGGIYLDLDDGCNRRLDPLLAFSAWVRRTIPTGISNDAMGSVPQHPFFLKVIELLQHYDRNWLMPYITVMYSTGPLFLSVVWKRYMWDTRPAEEHLRILMPDEYAKKSWSFFVISKGNSWHGKDAQTIFWMGQHWLFLTVTGFAIAGVVGACLWWTWATWLMKGSRPQSSGRRGVFFFWGRSNAKDRYELLNRMA
ncbi:putative glycosyl transferase [Phlyctema vagabunda]|uniref:Glycosyl transferase n=1 Tax=Phlyctema vagabunda TaxID=108571 RepID=A0ABR4PQS1_9HELO